VLNCAEAFKCTLGCITTQVDYTCASACVSSICPEAARLYQDALSCLVAASSYCGSDQTCTQKFCSSQISACLSSSCTLK
jgi:hypothetical protein